MRGIVSKGAGAGAALGAVAHRGALRAFLGGMRTRWEAVSKKGLVWQGATPAVFACAACWSGEGWGHFPAAA